MTFTGVAFQRCLLALAFAASTLAVDCAQAEEYIKLRPPATAKGFVGGESHDSYSIHARKGQTLTVQIAWKLEHDEGISDNHAEFWVGDSPDYGSGVVKFGRKSDNGKTLTGKIPRTGIYYIYVTAYPTADYTLKVTVK